MLKRDSESDCGFEREAKCLDKGRCRTSNICGHTNTVVQAGFKPITKCTTELFRPAQTAHRACRLAVRAVRWTVKISVFFHCGVGGSGWGRERERECVCGEGG